MAEELPEGALFPTGPMAEVTLTDIVRSAGLAADQSGAMPRDANDALLLMAHSTDPDAMRYWREELLRGIADMGGLDAVPGLILMWWFCGFKAGLEWQSRG